MNGIRVPFVIKKGATGKTLQMQLIVINPVTQEITPVNLVAGVTEIRFKMRRLEADPTAPGYALKVDRAVSATDGVNGRLAVEWQAADLDTPADYGFQVNVTRSGKLEIYPDHGLYQLTVAESL